MDGSAPGSPRSCSNGSRPQSGSPVPLPVQPAGTSAHCDSQSASTGVAQRGTAGTTEYFGGWGKKHGNAFLGSLEQ